MVTDNKTKLDSDYTTQVNVRLGNSEIAILDNYAKDYGLRSRAAALRSIVVQFARLQAERAGVKLEEE